MGKMKNGVLRRIGSLLKANEGQRVQPDSSRSELEENAPLKTKIKLGSTSENASVLANEALDRFQKAKNGPEGTEVGDVRGRSLSNQTAGSAQPRKRSKLAEKLMSKLQIGWRRMLEMFGLVRSRQAVKYSKKEKLLMVRVVLTKMDIIYARKHRVERDKMIDVVNEAEVHGPETVLDESESDEVRKIAISVCDEVAQLFSVTPADLKAWFCEFAYTSDIVEEGKSETVMNLDYKGKLDIGAAAEAAEYLMRRSEEGHRTS